MRISWKLGRVAGIDLFVHPTFLLLLAFVGASQGGLAAVLLVSAVFGCVLLHELGHALTARFCGIQTQDITLYPIGGVARLSRMPRKPAAELLITLAGPAVNVVIAGALAVFLSLGSGGDPWTIPSPTEDFLGALMSINLMLAAFNMIPAFPMDGGRVLRALLSGWVGRLRATEIAANIGQLLALAFGLWSVYHYELLRACLAAFVYMAAGAELARVRFEEQQNRLVAGGHGIWTAPAGYRWVDRGNGVWTLAPAWAAADDQA
jgi:Zn-dependent protease